MALRIRQRLGRIASVIPTWDSTFPKFSSAFSTHANFQPPPDPDDDLNISSSQRPLKNFMMLIGYRGTNYYGVTMNPGQDEIPTAGKEIVKACIKAGYSDESYLLSAKSLSQASRTDRGVSALRQVISMNLMEDVDLNKIQPYLPEDIKIYAIQRTIRKFVPFRMCEGRSYLYYIPSYVFAPLSMEMNEDYRLTTEASHKIKRILDKFVGHKNYHNFTRGRSYHDPRSQRDINKVELLDPVVKDGMELACIRLQGESFILNQIRKIVGAIVTAVRGYTPENMIDIALSKQGIPVSRAPPFGLMLEDMSFDWYNEKFTGKKTGFEPIDFSKYEEEIEKLKDSVLSVLVATERKYEKTKLWVEELQYFNFTPYNKEQLALDSSLEYDETLRVIRSPTVSISGHQGAALFT